MGLIGEGHPKRVFQEIFLKEQIGNEKEKKEAQREYQETRDYFIKTLNIEDSKVYESERVAREENEEFLECFKEIGIKIAKVYAIFKEQESVGGEAFERKRREFINSLKWYAQEYDKPLETDSSKRTSEPEPREDKALFNALNYLNKAFSVLLEYQGKQELTEAINEVKSGKTSTYNSVDEMMMI